MAAAAQRAYGHTDLATATVVERDVDKHVAVKEHIFRSKLPDIDIPSHLNVVEYVFSEACNYPDRTCIIDAKTGKKYTYAEVQVSAKRVAAGLAKLGMRKGEVVMLLLPNCPEFVLVLLGVAMAGGIATTANPAYTPADLTKQALGAGAKIIVTLSASALKLVEPLEAAIAAEQSDRVIQILTVDAPPQNCKPVSVLLEADEKELPEVQIDPEEVVVLPYSSGTSGFPKGVMITYKGLVTNIAQVVDGDEPAVYFDGEDVILCLLPLFHIYSLVAACFCALRRGCTMLIMPKYDLVQLFELCQCYRVTIALLAPPIMLAIAKSPLASKYDVSSVRMVVSAAAPLGKETEDEFRKKLPNVALGQGYGMTEAGPVCSLSLAFRRHPALSIPKPGSSGMVVRNAEVKIVDTDTGVSLSYNQPGEFCLRSPQIMKGYLNDPMSSAFTIDQEGWLHTGDVAYIDEDEEVFIVDRVKELIKFKGFQVPPAELEALLVSHPSILDAAVIPKSDEVAGEVPVAFVVKSPGSNITKAEIKDFIASQVVFYKRVHDVIFADSIPKSVTGKILRKDLRSRLAELYAQRD